MSDGPSEYEVLLEQARLQLNQQEQSLDLLRTRATAIISIGGIVAALFAPHFLPHAGNLTLGALGSLFAVVFLGIFILWPKEWNMGVPLFEYQDWIDNHRQWRRQYAPDASDLAQPLTEEIAATLVIAYARNRGKYKWLTRAYSAQVLMLLVEIALWVVATLGH